MGGGTPSAQTTSSVSEPWKGAQPYLTDVMSRARGLIGNPGTMPSSVIPFDPATETALQGYETRARANLAAGGDPLAQASQTAVKGALEGDPTLTGIARGMGTLGSTTGQGIFENIAQSGGVNPYRDRIVAAGAAPTTEGLDTLRRTAAGDFENPHLLKMFDQGAAKVSDAVSSRFFGQGSGSAAEQKLLQEGLGDLYTNIMAPAYEAERGRQMTAAGLLPQIQQADRAAAMGALNTGAGLAESETSRRLGAASELDSGARADVATRLDAATRANAGRLGAIGALPAVGEAQDADLQDLLRVGQTREDLAASEVSDALARYQLPWDQLSNYSGIISGFGNLGGTTTTTQPGQRTNRFMGGLSGAAGLGSLAMMIPGLQGLAIPMMLAGGALGASG